MEFNLDFLTELIRDRKTAERFLNPIKSDYQKILEQSGWEFVDNHNFYSMFDELEDVQKIWGDDIKLVRESLRKKMKRFGNWYKEIHSAEKVRFVRAFDIYGNRIPVENRNIFAGVYIKRRAS
ncbi:MAG: hypothetical protein AABY03_01145 [Nanoarchaeota archaeon]